MLPDHDGTWLAGRDGPPGMIMPAVPRVGDVYRPENIPGLVFEEVTVQSTGETVDGPRGPVAGAVRVAELLMDGTREQKVFAPGYGEFRAEVAADRERVTVALAVPVDGVGGPVPADLVALWHSATALWDAVERADRAKAGAALAAMATSWAAYREGGVPALLDTHMREALDALAAAVGGPDTGAARGASVAVAQAVLDLRLRHEPRTDVDLARLDLVSRQLIVDAAGEDAAAASGDVATLSAIWERAAHAVDAPARRVVEDLLGGLRPVMERRDFPAAAALAARLRDAPLR